MLHAVENDLNGINLPNSYLSTAAVFHRNTSTESQNVTSAAGQQYHATLESAPLSVFNCGLHYEMSH